MLSYRLFQKPRLLFVLFGFIILVAAALMLQAAPLHLSSKNFTERKIIVITDLEPDDRVALSILLSVFDEKNILCVGTTVLHAGRKKALAERLLTQLGCSEIPVYQGHGGTPDLYARFASTIAAKSYLKEGDGILSKQELNEIKKSSPSSDELQKHIEQILKEAESRSIEIILLAPPTDLVVVLQKFPDLKEKIKRIYLMGGWMEVPEGRSIHLRASYNWNMDCQASSSLMKMSDIPMTLFSSHILKQYFSGGSVNAAIFPHLIQKMNSSRLHRAFLNDNCRAVLSWNNHLMKTTPGLSKSIGPYADHQFTSADPAVVIGMVYPELITKERKGIKIEISPEDKNDKGHLVKISHDPTSNIELVEEIDIKVFEDALLKSLQ